MNIWHERISHSLSSGASKVSETHFSSRSRSHAHAQRTHTHPHTFTHPSALTNNTYTQTHTHPNTLHTNAGTHTHTHTHTYKHTHVCALTFTYKHICTHICAYYANKQRVAKMNFSHTTEWCKKLQERKIKTWVEQQPKLWGFGRGTLDRNLVKGIELL